ncbi:MAG: hypothetical protein U0Z53_06010 [Blastocatellia bacterium]
MSRTMRIELLLLLCLSLAVVMTSVSAQPAATPDRKAFTEALKIKEPDKKIAALEKFLADFPKSQAVAQAHLMIFDTLVKNFPDQKARIIEQGNKYIEKSQEFARPFLYNDLAGRLLDAGILLDEAEKLAVKGLAATEEELAKTARQRKAGYYASLGRIYLKQSKLKEAEKNLKLAAEYNPQLTTAQVGLAELYLKQGNEKLALETYATAAASGKVSAATRRQFEELYSKQHGGSTRGLDEMLDEKYHKLFPMPVKVTAYAPSAKRTKRTVLAEVFTGAGCGPCVAADLGFDAMMERYRRDELTVLMYHLHIPAPDPMTNPATQARGKYYEVQGVPSYVLDGRKSSGGGTREMTQGFYDRVNPDVESQLEKNAEADLKIDAAMDGLVIKGMTTVSNVKSDSANLKLHVVLAEEKVRYSGENGIRFHPMVVRSVAGSDYGGFAVTAKDQQTFAWTFDLSAISAEAKKHLDEYEKTGRSEPFTFSEKKDQIDPNSLTVVAFVQDEKSKAVLQSASFRIKRQVASNGN